MKGLRGEEEGSLRIVISNLAVNLSVIETVQHTVSVVMSEDLGEGGLLC